MTTTLPLPQLCSTDSVRSLGGLEHFFSLIDQHRPVHFAMAAQIEGYVPVLAWRMALDKLQERHPLLSVAIETNDSGAPCLRRVEDARIPLRITSGPTVSNWQAEVAQELATKFDPQQAPLARAVLMQGRNESVFILVTHHSIADGLSSAYAIRDVLRSLAGESLEPLPAVPAMEPLVYMSRPVTHDANEAPQPDGAQAGKPGVFHAIDGSLPRIEALQLTPAATRKLAARAREERTTVHGALSAALVLAGRESSSDWNDSPVRVLSPFNLRKELGIGEDCGLFVWAAPVAMNPRTLADFWDSARFAKSALTDRQSLGRVAMEMENLAHAANSGLDVPGAAQILAHGFPHELLLTNLGKLSIQCNWSSFRLKALWGPSVLMGFENGQTVGVTTTNDSLCLLHTSFTPIPSLLTRAAEILRLACDGPK